MVVKVEDYYTVRLSTRYNIHQWCDVICKDYSSARELSEKIIRAKKKWFTFGITQIEIWDVFGIFQVIEPFYFCKIEILKYKDMVSRSNFCFEQARQFEKDTEEDTKAGFKVS